MSYRIHTYGWPRRAGLEPGLQLVDVRAATETADGIIPGAREIPLAVLADSHDALDRNLPVVAYCASGYRSQVAASSLAAAGFLDVSDLLGGYSVWHRAGRPDADDLEHVESASGEQVSEPADDALHEAGETILDVREPSEWQRGHAPGPAS